MLRLTKSPLFESRYVSHRHMWTNDDDSCYECIDKTNYSSVVVRLQRLNGDVEKLKHGIEKATECAFKHSNLCDLTEVVIDEANKICISVSENARGISLQRYVKSCSSKPGYLTTVKKILQNLLMLYRDLMVGNRDLTTLDYAHIVIVLQGQEPTLESLKIRRPFICKYRPRSSELPYKNYETFPAFVDIGAAAFYCLTHNDFFAYPNLDAAKEVLQNYNEKLFFELLFAFQTPEFDAVDDLIKNMDNLGDAVSVFNRSTTPSSQEASSLFDNDGLLDESDAEVTADGKGLALEVSDYDDIHEDDDDVDEITGFRKRVFNSVTDDSSDDGLLTESSFDSDNGKCKIFISPNKH